MLFSGSANSFTEQAECCSMLTPFTHSLWQELPTWLYKPLCLYVSILLGSFSLLLLLLLLSLGFDTKALRGIDCIINNVQARCSSSLLCPGPATTWLFISVFLCVLLKASKADGSLLWCFRLLYRCIDAYISTSDEVTNKNIYVKRVQSWSQRPFSTSMFRKPNSWVHASSVPVSSVTDISIIFQVRVIGGDPRRPIMSIFWYFLLLLGISSGNYSCDSAFKWTPYSISIWLVCQFRLGNGNMTYLLDRLPVNDPKPRLFR